MDTRARSTHKTLIALAKITLGVAILAYLLWQVQQHDGFRRLIEEPKNWSFLAAGLCCTFIAVTLGFIRWHILVTALGLKFRVVDALRLGSLGFMLNFVTLGSIGGDLFRAIFLARQQPGRRTHAVATVVADRVMGLLTMLTLASAGVLAADLIATSSRELAVFCRIILAASAAGWLGVALVLTVPALSSPWLSELVERIPIAGKTLGRLVDAVRLYRDEKRQLALAAALSGTLAVFYISSYYFVARGLPVHEPSWTQHLVIVPIASLAGAIPATPNGLGTLEAAIEVLYRAMPGSREVVAGDGTMVALAHRVTMMAVAMVGMAYYLSHRAEVREMIHEAEEAPEMA